MHTLDKETIEFSSLMKILLQQWHDNRCQYSKTQKNRMTQITQNMVSHELNINAILYILKCRERHKHRCVKEWRDAYHQSFRYQLRMYLPHMYKWLLLLFPLFLICAEIFIRVQRNPDLSIFIVDFLNYYKIQLLLDSP